MVSVRKELALAYSRNNMLTEAVEEYKEILDVDPENIGIHYKLGDIYTFHKKWEEAISEFKQVIDVDPGDGLARMKIIDIYFKMYEKADNRQSKYFSILKEYQAAVEAAPGDVMTHFELGYAYMKLSANFVLSNDERANSIFEFKQAISIDPENMWPYWGLRMIYIKESVSGEHMYDEAIEICKHALEKSPNDSRSYFELGEAYHENYDKNMKNQAVTMYKKAIELNSKFVDAYYRLAGIYRVKGMFEEAVRCYNMVIELDPIGSLAKDARRSLVHIEKSREAIQS